MGQAALQRDMERMQREQNHIEERVVDAERRLAVAKTGGAKASEITALSENLDYEVRRLQDKIRDIDQIHEALHRSTAP
jgi:predicted  nucleic acid-binding Zn-ribbon protein